MSPVVRLSQRQHNLLTEALRRYTMPGSTASNQPIAEAWTGLGSYTEYAPCVPSFMVCIHAQGHTPGITNWWKLNDEGVRVVSEWIRQGYHSENAKAAPRVLDFDDSKLIRADRQSRLFILKSGCCLGFDVCDKWSKALASEMDQPYSSFQAPIGTLAAYDHYQKLVSWARINNLANGWRSCSQLTPQLIGKEGWRVEVIDKFDEKRRFIVGKSSGFIPCHIEVPRRDSSGGVAAMGTPFKSVHMLYQVR